jgi:hypothetical protein
MRDWQLCAQLLKVVGQGRNNSDMLSSEQCAFQRPTPHGATPPPVCAPNSHAVGLLLQLHQAPQVCGCQPSFHS